MSSLWAIYMIAYIRIFHSWCAPSYRIRILPRAHLVTERLVRGRTAGFKRLALPSLDALMMGECLPHAKRREQGLCKIDILKPSKVGVDHDTVGIVLMVHHLVFHRSCLRSVRHICVKEDWTDLPEIMFELFQKRSMRLNRYEPRSSW